MSYVIHFLNTYPNALPAFLMGVLTGIGLALWGKAKNGCFLASLYLYIFGAWVFTIGLYVLTQLEQTGVFFLLGLAVYFAKPLFFFFHRIFEWWLDWQASRRYDQHHTRKDQQDQNQDHAQTDNSDQEQQRRYQEERKRREEWARQQRQQKQAPQEPPETPSSDDSRTAEQVLGLPASWTREELVKAYRRETQRLHPDKWTGKPQAIRDEMEREFKRVQEAYKRLKK
ncbi:J domain-containing protein [Thiofilum flexile]|uniref:J domain-containing protein n=1 Tax=Thiofilum flexile TaxID=125627 RepID=UPI000381EB0D|nr:J domain-containing protein [Thiofilum flexile]